MSKYVCGNCKKQIENEADFLIIDKMSGSGEVDGYLAICPECLKKIVPEAREECKSCLYYEICNAIGLVGIESTENIKCVRYKDRSRFVELPCDVGDKIFVPTRNFVSEYEISYFHIGKQGMWFNSDVIDGISTRLRNGNFDDIGKTVFLTRAEAEQALKERESNAE